MEPQYLLSDGGRQIAYEQINENSDGPGLMWLSGFNSDMQGTKVLALKDHAMRRGQPFIAYDYSGHGQSHGKFVDGTITYWLEDSLAVLDELTKGPQILVGSSMGGWLALLIARERRERVAGLVLIAPAPDFTENLMWQSFDRETQTEIMETGVYLRPSNYGDPYPITKQLIEDGRNWLLMDKKLDFNGPVRLLQGMRDEDVPWNYAFELLRIIDSDDVIATLNKEGDHRLSTDTDIQRLLKTCDEITKIKKI